jgi:hypothetical protein
MRKTTIKTIFFYSIIILVTLVLSFTFYNRTWQEGDLKLLYAKTLSFFKIENKLGEEILVDNFIKSACERFNAMAAQLAENLPTCPFSGKVGEIYVTDEHCNTYHELWDWEDYHCTLNNPENYCYFNPDVACQAGDDCCGWVQVGGQDAACGTITNCSSFFSYCVDQYTREPIWGPAPDYPYMPSKSYLCIIR